MSAGLSLLMAVAISLCLSTVLVYVLSVPLRRVLVIGLRISSASPRAGTATGKH
jgi:hypothetical protein